MSEQELKEWFFSKLNCCYSVKYDDYSNHIFWFYDDQYVRKLKLNRIYNYKINNSLNTGTCLFRQDIKNKYLWIDYNTIWIVFEKYYNSHYNIKNIILKWIKNDTQNNIYLNNSILSNMSGNYKIYPLTLSLFEK